MPRTRGVNNMVREQTALQRKSYEIVFGTETRWGRNLDLLVIAAILCKYCGARM